MKKSILMTLAAVVVCGLAVTLFTQCNKDKEKNGMPRFNLTWLYVILLIVLGIAWFSSSDDSASKSATYTEFKEYVEKGYANKIVANKDEG